VRRMTEVKKSHTMSKCMESVCGDIVACVIEPSTLLTTDRMSVLDGGLLQVGKPRLSSMSEYHGLRALETSYGDEDARTYGRSRGAMSEQWSTGLG
jgi:hypothetical protein